MGYTNKKHPLKIIINITLVIFLIGAYLFFKQIQSEYTAINTFEACVDAGYPVLEMYPEQCKIPGKIFVNKVQVHEPETKEETAAVPETSMNPKNTSYDIEGEHIPLQNGKWIPSNQSSSSLSIISYFGNELRMDINQDGKEDTVFIITDRTQGEGIFYYLVTALNNDGGYRGTNGVLLGDRISPQSTEWSNDKIVVTYAERKPNEPITAKPSILVSRYFSIENSTLIEIEK